MAYDEGLAQRVREALTDLPTTERAMFGGLAFMLNGNMCCGINRDALMIRVAPEEHDAALAEPGVRPFEMTGRPMKGWLLVDGEGLEDDGLTGWVDRSVAFVTSLPPK